MQTKRQSTVEAIAGTVLGYLIGVAAGQWVIFPVFGIRPTLAANAELTLCFTAFSLVRSYLVRRFFNWLHR